MFPKKHSKMTILILCVFMKGKGIITVKYMQLASHNEIHTSLIIIKLVFFSLWLTLFQHEPLQGDPANTLSKFTFCLPACRISESTEKLMNLAYETLIEATQSTPQWYVCLLAAISP